MGLVGIIGSDDLLACFVAGNSLTWNDWYRIEHEKGHLMEVVDNLLNISIFIYIGLTMVRNLHIPTITLYQLPLIAMVNLF